MINHGIIAAYLDKDAATIRNNVMTAISASTIVNMGQLNTAWKNLNRKLNLSSSVSKYVAILTTGNEYIDALSQSIEAYKRVGVYNKDTASVYTGGTSGYVGAVLCPDGTVYSAPRGTTNGGFVYFPDIESYQTASGPISPGANQYYGAVLMADGRIITVPQNGTSSRIYDYTTRAETYYTTHKFSTGFANGCLLPNGHVFFNPNNATRATIFDPVTETTKSSAGTAYSGSAASYQPILCPNGKIISIPYNATKIYIYDYTTNSASVHSSTMPGSAAFLGGCVLPDGKVFFTPYASTTARIYDPVADTVSTPTPTFPGGNAYLGSILMPNGIVLLVPAQQTKPGFYNYLTDTYTTSSTVWHAVSYGYYGACVLPNGSVYVNGYNSLRSRRYTPLGVSQSNVLILSTFQNKCI